MSAIPVTGIAWSTALGDGIDTVWDALTAGRSGIRPVPSAFPLRNDAAATVDALARHSPRTRLAELAWMTIVAALRDASANPLGFDPETTFLVLGTSFGATLDDETSAHEPLGTWVAAIAERLGVIPIALSTACSSGSDAILVGTELIRAGLATVCICGGVDVLTDAKRLAHSALRTMSPSALRAFDRERSGTLLGEGAGIVVLEAPDRVTGKPRHGKVRGCGAANDAAGLTAPDAAGRGVKLAVQRCLADAGLEPEDIGILNAHGSGTLANDAGEARAYSALFSAHRPILFATKGAFGHSLGATGALEAITVILGLERGIVPPITALTDPINECRLPLAQGASTRVDARFGLSVTIGFGGFNTSLLFERAHA